MAIIVEVFKNDEVVNRKDGVSSKGREYSMFTQIGYISLGGQYPVQFKIRHEDEAKPYLSGKYELAPESLAVNGFGELEASRITVLTPIKA
ncbi:TPA: single-stranded DNA-binding protein [Photobacterium damselae]